jgi:hypothetical protein
VADLLILNPAPLSRRCGRVGKQRATAAFSLNGTDVRRARLHATRFVANRVYLIASNVKANKSIWLLGLITPECPSHSAILTSIFTPPVCCLHTTVLTE